MEGLVFHIQRFSLFDGPGVRTVVFLSGCPLRCVWCHNPEGLEKRPRLLYAPEKCIGCGACVGVCPGGCHTWVDGRHGLNRTACTGCGLCAAECVTEALTVAGSPVTVETVMAEVLRDLPAYRESGGGMTLSGGEPLYQPDFAIALLTAAREAGVSSCIETSGMAPASVMEAAACLCDYVYFDYKATGEASHLALCGAKPTRILENLALLDHLQETGAFRGSVVLRCPLIPDRNMTPEHLAGIAETAAAHPSVSEIHLEPYHALGVSKSRRLGEEARYDGAPPSREDAEAWALAIARQSGKPCRIS